MPANYIFKQITTHDIIYFFRLFQQDQGLTKKDILEGAYDLSSIEEYLPKDWEENKEKIQKILTEKARLGWI